MSDVVSQIESLLFISNKPLSHKKLKDAVGASDDALSEAIAVLRDKYASGGVRLVEQGSNIQFSTAPESHIVVEDFLKAEISGDVTRPQLEALTIIAYRGPLLKEELEHIRGVNCSLILRNLLVRGLVEGVTSGPDKQVRYQITLDFLRFLGIERVDQLPDYATLSQHEHIESILEKHETSSDSSG